MNEKAQEEIGRLEREVNCLEQLNKEKENSLISLKKHYEKLDNLNKEHHLKKQTLLKKLENLTHLLTFNKSTNNVNEDNNQYLNTVISNMDPALIYGTFLDTVSTQSIGRNNAKLLLSIDSEDLTRDNNHITQAEEYIRIK